MKKPDILRPYQFSIIDRYILKDFLKSVFASMTLFIAIYLFSLLINDIPYFISQMVDRKNPNVTMSKILTMYVNQIPDKALLVSPLAFLFSTMYTMGNFYKNNEAVAYIGAGVHLFRLTFFILLISFVYSLFLIPFTNYVVVPTLDKALALSRQMRNKVKRDRTTDFEIFGENNVYYFIKRYDPKAKIMYYPIIAKERKLNKDHIPIDYKKAFFPSGKVTDESTKKVKATLEPTVSAMGFFKQLYSYTTDYIYSNNLNSTHKKTLIQQVQGNVEVGKNINTDGLEKNKLPVNIQKSENKVDEDQTDLTIEDDFPVDLFKAPEPPKGPENPELKRKKLVASFQSLDEPNIDFSRPLDTYDNRFPDLEHKYLYPGTQDKQKPSYQSLVDRSTTLVDTNRLLDPSDQSDTNKSHRSSPSKTKSSNNTSDTKDRSNDKTKGVRPTFDDLYNLSKESANRNQVYKRLQVSKRNASRINKDLSVQKPPLTYQPYSTDQNIIGEGNQSLSQGPPSYPNKQSSKEPYQSKGLSTTDERNLIESPEFSSLTSIGPALKEKRVRAKSYPVSQFKIQHQTYRNIPYTPYFKFRIDAEKAVWNSSIKRWMIYNGTKRYWHKTNGLEKVINLSLPQIIPKNVFENTILKNLSQDLMSKKIRSYYSIYKNEQKNNIYKLTKSIKKLSKQEKSDILSLLSIIPPNQLNRPATKIPTDFTQSVFKNIILKSVSNREIRKLITSYYRLNPKDQTYELKGDMLKNEEDKMSNILKLLGYVYILNEVNDRPEHILIKNKEMDRLTYAEGITLITRLKRARKKWKGLQIDLYSNKFAFQLSTFLIVLVGTTLGQFHSRKLIFINSLFKSILIFLLYFVLFQLGVSLAKVLGFIPIFLAPWVGNIAFLGFGFYMMKRAKT